MRRLLVITPLPEGGAGFRYRIQQYLPTLVARGIEPTVRPFYSDRFFQLAFVPGRFGTKAGLSLQQTAKRLGQLGSLGRYDAVLMYREALPVGPPVWEWLCAKAWRRPIVFDFDDAIFLPRTSPANWFLHPLKWPSRVNGILRWSRSVMAGNAYLASYAKRYAAQVGIIPTSIDTRRFVPRRTDQAPARRVPVVGWIGTPTAVNYLEGCLGALRQVARERRFILKVVGAGRPLAAEGLRVEQRAWALAQEAEEFRSCDIGIYPMVDEPWALGKCGLKALQFMACGVPVVASAIGLNTEIIQDGANGFLARLSDEWVKRLTALLDDPALRMRLGAAGRQTVEARYSLARTAPRFLEAVEAAWDGGTPQPHARDAALDPDHVLQEVGR